VGRKADGAKQNRWGAGSVWVERPVARPGYAVARGRLSEGGLTVRASAAVRKAGLPASFTVHSLRHGHATALQAAGVDLHTISGRLGHSGVGITS
jgi:integrase